MLAVLLQSPSGGIFRGSKKNGQKNGGKEGGGAGEGAMGGIVKDFWVVFLLATQHFQGHSLGEQFWRNVYRKGNNVFWGIDWSWGISASGSAQLRRKWK